MTFRAMKRAEHKVKKKLLLLNDLVLMVVACGSFWCSCVYVNHSIYIFCNYCISSLQVRKLFTEKATSQIYCSRKLAFLDLNVKSLPGNNLAAKAKSLQEEDFTDVCRKYYFRQQHI